MNPIAKLSSVVADYWTDHNVTLHKTFASREESLEYFHWRCDQYPGYLDLMPVSGVDGLEVLDYGCGPGHDLVGFVEYSRPKRVAGVDVSRSSLSEARARLGHHGGSDVQLVLSKPGETVLPFENASFDYVHSSGVLHHVPDLQASLAEIRRVLRPTGRARVMVYNYDSLWTHLYVPYTMQLRDRRLPAHLSIREAFTKSTDGPDCPIANCYTPQEFADEARKAGFGCRTVGAAVSLHELQQLQLYRLEACMDQRLAREHREFLLNLTFDQRGTPLANGLPAGVDLVLELNPL
ncbi:MAG TPA: class I SAM-dependent methyltransferase [Ramlibacter sp.]|nr:class I SAM-dependent methyltransferase [Ramlibacter sp.]